MNMFGCGALLSQSNSSNCLVLILHSLLGKFIDVCSYIPYRSLSKIKVLWIILSILGPYLPPGYAWKVMLMALSD